MADRSEDIIRAFQDVEAWLLRQIALAVARGADGTAGHYQARLGEVQALLTAVDQRLATLEAGLAELVEETIGSGWEQGAVQAVATVPDGVPPTVPTGAVAALTAETTTALVSQRPAILRSVQDSYRRVVQQVTTRAVVSGAPIDTIVQDALDKFATRGITSFTDRAGKRWSLDSYTRMALRTSRNRAMNEGRRESFQANGITLIQTSWHEAPAPVCEPYQGRILSLDGIAGERVVWDRVNDREMTVHVTATLEEAEANGYHHPNCAHVDTAYIPGQPVPEPPEVDPDDYVQSQRQRAIERHIRHWKKRQMVAVTPQAEAKAKAKVRAWQAAQRRHVEQNWFLRRNYSRERLFQGNGQNAS